MRVSAQFLFLLAFICVSIAKLSDYLVYVWSLLTSTYHLCVSEYIRSSFRKMRKRIMLEYKVIQY